jgi:peptidoglycan hydrolase CwlO-like protein
LKNRAEVIAMVLYEFDIEKYKQQQEDKITLLQDTVQKQQLTLQQKDDELQVLQQQQNDFRDALQQKDNDLKVQAQQIDNMSQRIKELEEQLAQIQ